MSTSLAISHNQASSAVPAVLALTTQQPSDAQAECEGALATTGSVRHFSKDCEIYGEGGEAEAFFKVVSGVVRTCKFLSNGRRQIDAFHVEGHVFGFELGAEHRLSAEAVTDCTIIAYQRRVIERLTAGNDALSQQLFSYAVQNMTRAQEHSLLLARQSAIEKVMAFLMEWADHAPQPGMIALAMTRQDIADYLGLTIETVSRTLSRLVRDAVIELPSTRDIHLKNPAALHALNV